MAEGIEFLVFGQVGIEVETQRGLPGHGIEARAEGKSHVAPRDGCRCLAEMCRRGPFAVDIAYPECRVSGMSSQYDGYLRVGSEGVDCAKATVGDADLVREGRYQQTPRCEVAVGICPRKLGRE